MVIQRGWENVELSQQNSISEETSSVSWSFQTPSKPTSPRATPTPTTQVNQPATRQIAINTLAAMHRRFTLPGPVQPYSRPISEFRASANKALDMLRQTIQSAVSKEIDQVIKKYLEKFFVPAVNNIRLNLGEESVSEDQEIIKQGLRPIQDIVISLLDSRYLSFKLQVNMLSTIKDALQNLSPIYVSNLFSVRAVCRAMLDATRLLYATPKPGQLSTDTTDIYSTGYVDIKLESSLNKRKDSDTDDLLFSKRKKIKQEDLDCVSPSLLPAGLFRDPDKWNPIRLTPDTLFIMGSHAHKVLGMGNARGRLYTKHAGLPRYPADSVDKEWIASHNLVNAVGGKTYIMVLEDIEELATSDAYRHSSLPMLGELSGFKVPPFMLRKIRSYIVRKAITGDISNPSSPQATSSAFSDLSADSGKFENSNQVIANMANRFSLFTPMQLIKDDSDFADIKIDGIKVEDIDDIKVEEMDDIKVENIKEEDLDVDSIKVENLDDIQEEDIKLEHDDTLSVCKQTEDEEDELEGLLDADIEFLSRNLGSIESDTDARKTIEKLTGADADTITLVGDEFDLGATLNNHFPDIPTTKCITVASTTTGMIHSVPVSHLTPPKLSGSTVHYYASTTTVHPGQRTIHHLPPATLTIQSIPGTNSQVIRGIPINTKSGTFSTVMSQGTASVLGLSPPPPSTASATTIGSSTQYLNVNSKSFPTGNILHNAIVSRNHLNRYPNSSYSLATLTPMQNITSPKSNTVSSPSLDYDTISTTKDMIENACNSSLMLKKVLTLGSAGVAKSFVMQNSQKTLTRGFATGPPNVTIVSSGMSGGRDHKVVVSSMISPTSSNLSASHATLSALLASNADFQIGKE